MLKAKTVLAAIALALHATAASADGLVTHNGSLMEVIKLQFDTVEIRYVQPRPGLWEIGVRPGTVLLRGKWVGPTLYATAVVFSGECAPIPYPVSGFVDQNNVLVLQGPSPWVDPESCRVLGPGAPHKSTLVFEPLQAPVYGRGQ